MATVTEIVDKWNEVSQTQRVTFYQQIFVKPTVGPTQVTFDDNGTHNYWGYQLERDHMHISELFHIENVGLNTITIVGFRPPQSKWYLSVNEFLGVPEKHPKFVPESQVHEGDASLHTVFTADFNFGKYAISFKTKQDGRTVYLLPGPPSERFIETKVTEEAQYAFTFGETFTREELESLGIGWEICQDEEL